MPIGEDKLVLVESGGLALEVDLRSQMSWCNSMMV